MTPASGSRRMQSDEHGAHRDGSGVGLYGGHWLLQRMGLVTAIQIVNDWNELWSEADRISAQGT
jgi:hypothetical protein